MLHWHSPREDLIGVIALIVYVITCGSLSGGRNGSILDSHTIYFLSFGAFNLQESPLRIRGEKHCACFRRTHSRGSPPRMRGKAVVGELAPPCRGITPAHAGKSVCASMEKPLIAYHPRTCGEKQSGVPGIGRKEGSPPRMRGKVPCIDFVESKGEDHPRACGEKIQGRLQGSLYRGSPPRMRGKEHAKNACCSWTRITPAHAGKSLSAVTPSLTAKDHPRACGEKMHFLNQMTSLWGSPPRMRGKDVACPASTAGAGITPAHAGKRKAAQRVLVAAQDYPRACGEKHACPDRLKHVPGSPPRMRGKVVQPSLFR